MITTGPLDLGMRHWLLKRLFPLNIRLPSQLSLWRYRKRYVRLSPLLWLLRYTLPTRLLHLQEKAVVVGAEGVVEVEILSRFQPLATVTAVVKRVTMCGTVPSKTHTRRHFLLLMGIRLTM